MPDFICMIPLQLTLKNFLSYRKTTLDFRGLHVACICGANGAGKSSLLEAITWALWGQSRALTEDDVIHLGELDAIVDFIFQYQQQTYRVIRSRRRGQASTLEFQIQTTQGFRSLTEKGLRATQQLILYHLKLDYDTFINSAYLRQGRADEFMLKRPTERKQILTDLLKLDRYDELAEQAKEQVRQLKADLGSLERNLETIAAQLQQGEGLAIEEANLRVVLNRLHQQQEQDQQRLRQQQAIQQQRQAGVQQLTLQQQQQQHLLQDCRRLQQDLNQLQQQQRQLEAILQDAETIATHYNQFQRLQAEEELQSAKFQTYQAAQTQLQALRQQQAEQVNQLTDELRRLQAQQETLVQQQQEIQETLSKSAEVEASLEQLRQVRTRLTELDHQQMKAAPLVQRRQQIQTQLDRAQARLVARLEELHTTQRQLEQHQHRQPHLQQAIEAITQQIAHLEKRRLYQQQVREKGMERRTFMERLQERQREYERDLAELDQKIALLKREHPESLAESLVESRLEPIAEPVAAYQAVAIDHRLAAETDGVYSLSASLPRAAELRPKPFSLVPSPEPYPPCPLCDRPLDEHHWNVVLEHHQTERQEICTQLWVIREQLTTSDREIRI
ncbi:MAG TPA: SMC family ATPase, partial [Allocoleopsis sp.]